MQEVRVQFGRLFREEKDYRLAPGKKEKTQCILMEEKLLPKLGMPIKKVSYLDGCKVYFQDGSWIIVRFSGTEPLLRIFTETDTRETSERLV